MDDYLIEQDASDVDVPVTLPTLGAFEKDLRHLINKYCIENYCDIPDFLLAQMVVDFITKVLPTTLVVLDWHGCDSVCHPADRNGDEDVF